MSEARLRGFTVLTRCKTVEEFIDQFHDRTGEHHTCARTIFVHTVDARVVGTECGFALLLADKKPVLAGTCIVLDVFRDANNPFKRPGMRLGVKRLGPDSESVFTALEAARELRAQPDTLVDMPPLPKPARMPKAVALRETQPLRVMTTDGGVSDGVVQAVTSRKTEPLGSRNLASRPPVRKLPTVQIPVVEAPAPRTPRATSNVEPVDVPRRVTAEGSSATKTAQTRTPGSSIVLPANPLTNLDDASLAGLVDLGWGEAKPPEPVIAPPPALPPPPTGPMRAQTSDVAYIVDARVEDGAQASIVTVVLPVGEPVVLARTPSAAFPAIPAPPPVVPRPMIELPRTRASLRRPLAIAAGIIAVAAAALIWTREAPSAAHHPTLVVESAEEVALAVRATAGLDPLPPPPPPVAKLHAVFVQTYPIGARVTVNGRSFGTTPTYAKIPANTPVELHVARAGYPAIVHAMTSKTATDRVFLDLRKRRR